MRILEAVRDAISSLEQGYPGVARSILILATMSPEPIVVRDFRGIPHEKLGRALWRVLDLAGTVTLSGNGREMWILASDEETRQQVTTILQEQGIG